MFKRISFELWYLSKPPWDTGISPPELHQFIAEKPAGRALDLGCGTGTNVITLARHNWQATGVDFAWTAIQLAKRKARQAGVSAQLKVSDVTRLEWLQGPFDLILDMGCYHNLDAAGQAAYRQNLARLLAVGGAFLLYTFVKDSPEPEVKGLLPSDVAQLEEVLTLMHREDGTDRGSRRSAWFHFERRAALAESEHA